MVKKRCIALILAGGQGTRLGVLTKRLAKPAVPFGGKYRIIDFALSNCANSGIDTVGIMTQYRPLALTAYIGDGRPWDLDRKDGGVFVLPPYAKASGGEWYKGTANAVYQNIEFVDRYNPEHILILSGDHIYKMDYSAMLEYHIQQESLATIAVITVPWEDAPRFGIVGVDHNWCVTEFVEKPAHPKSNLASTGIYIFKWDVLKGYLEADETNPASTHDFGKDIIPNMLQGGVLISAYPFQGYWKDVGTLESLWEANMDLLGDNPRFNLYDRQWRIYSVPRIQPPHYIGRNGIVRNSLVNEGCIIHGEIYHSVLFPGVYIGKNTCVYDSVIMPDVRIGDNVRIGKAIIGSEVVIGSDCVIGRFEGGKETSLTIVAEFSSVKAGSHIVAGV